MLRFGDLGHISKTISEKDDISVALLSVAVLEEILEELIILFLVDEKLSKKFVKNKLDNFNSKIELAYLLGVITKNERRDLHMIRRIRNEFAHSISILTFQSDSVNNRISELTNFPTNRVSNRDKYISVFMALSHSLIIRMPKVDINKCKFEDYEEFKRIYTNVGKLISDLVNKKL